MTVAVREDHTEMAEFLLKEGADVNFVDHDQRSVENTVTFVSTSPLLLKVNEFTFDFVAVIVFTCRSPLMIAAGNGKIGMLRLLLRFNADVTLKDAKGSSAEDYAVINGHHP